MRFIFISVTTSIFYAKKILMRILFFLVLCGCMETIQPSLPTAVLVTFGNETMVIASPKGFCVDEKLANRASGSMTLFIINCVRVKNSTEVTMKRRPISAILTATLVDSKISDISDISILEGILTKKPGINYLSRSQSDASLRVHKIEKKNNILLFLIEQEATDIGVKQSSYFWRAFFFEKDKMISLTASNFLESKRSQKKLKNLIIEFANNTMLANIS